MIISKAQFAVFRSDAANRFEESMLLHIQDYFPNHWAGVGEAQLRKVIQIAIVKGKEYGFTSRNSICLYLNCLLVLGCGFDTDPQYPWANNILRAKQLTRIVG